MLSLFNTGYGLQDQLDGVKNGIAIVSTGNTHIAITSGQYVYIQDHGTLAEGLYKATSNISANGTLSSSNVTAAGNALNTLNSNIAIPRSQISSAPSDLNDATVTGIYLYNLSTLHTPTNDYGLCFVVSNNNTSSSGSAWNYQYAMPTNGGLYFRRQINRGAWTSWEELALNSNLEKVSAKLNVTFTPAEHVTVSSDAINCYTHNGCLFFNMRISTDSSLNANTVGTFSGVQALNIPAYNYISCGLYDSTPANITARVGGGTNPVLQIFKNAGIPASCDVWVSGVIRLVDN